MGGIRPGRQSGGNSGRVWRLGKRRKLRFCSKCMTEHSQPPPPAPPRPAGVRILKAMQSSYLKLDSSVRCPPQCMRHKIFLIFLKRNLNRASVFLFMSDSTPSQLPTLVFEGKSNKEMARTGSWGWGVGVGMHFRDSCEA